MKTETPKKQTETIKQTSLARYGPIWIRSWFLKIRTREGEEIRNVRAMISSKYLESLSGLTA
eukprot:5366141-Amphidinium_carterae.1